MAKQRLKRAGCPRTGFDIGIDRAICEWLHNHFTAYTAAQPPPQNTAPPS